MATLAVSLRLSEFTAKRVANVRVRECERLRSSVWVRMHALAGKASSAFIDKEETEGNVMRRDASPVATAPHTPPQHCLLLLFDGWFNRVDFS